MALNPGSRLGSYEILGPLGAGGMGEVYRARDTRLDRSVAIKILPPEIASRPSYRERFEREARTISQLNHPNICVLYDIGDSDGLNYLVLEYLEGETLAQRLARGALPTAEALRIAIQIAGALELAHRSGVVHRDLKPANVMLTRNGAKLLDFGLARRQSEMAAPLDALTAAPLPSLTSAGTMLGTLYYMSPEQTEGREADVRSDVWGLGCVLYEMVSGARPFSGHSSADVIGSILRDTPPRLAAAGQGVPPALDRVVAQCLAKDPDERWQSVGDLRRELQWIGEEASGDRIAVGRPQPRSRDRLRVASIVVVSVAAALAWYFLAPNPPAPAVQTFAVVPPQGALGPPSVSPDGRMLAYGATDQDGRAVWIRTLEDAKPIRLSGTEDGGLPFWSPDSTRLGFLAGGRLKRIGVDGRGVQDIGPASGLSPIPIWLDDDTIIFSQRGQLVRLKPGGTPEPVFERSGDTVIDMLPIAVPGTSILLFTRSQVPFRPETAAVYVGSLDGSSPPRKLLDVPTARYAAPGYLVFPKEGKLVAQRFDPHPPSLQGTPFTVMDDFAITGIPVFGVSRTGTLIAGALNRPETQLAWFDRAGRQTGTVAMPRHCRNPELSPDEGAVALECYEESTGVGPRDIWLADLHRGTSTRLTFDAADDSDPVWAPDGRHLLFASNRGDRPGVYRKLAGGAAPDERLATWSTRYYTMSWAADAKLVLLQSAVPTRDTFVLALGSETPQPLIATSFDDIEAQFSPDGRFVLYASNESGRSDIYVQPFPATGDRWTISTDGGTDGRWRGDGREIYYLSPARVLQAVTFSASPRVAVGSPTVLFDSHVAGPLGIGQRFPYAVTRDGQRFLLYHEKTPPTPVLRVMLNWQSLDPAGPR